MDISFAGNAPGVVVPGLAYSIPLNPPFLYLEFGAWLPSFFPGFIGALDASGMGSATLFIPSAPQLVGYQLSAACIGIDPVSSALRISNGTQTLIN
jgi:hypothetical protein